MTGHLFQIPVEGIFHLYHDDTAYSADYIGQVLATFNEREQTLPARITVEIDGAEHQSTVWFTPDATLPENQRAQQIIADLFGWHMHFYGSVVIDGLDDETILRILRDA